MNRNYRKLMALAVLAAGVLTVETAAEFGGVDFGGVLVADAQAVVGHPLTPMSYAGVARRTARRTIVATNTYVATLPAGCVTTVIEGVTIHQCGSKYYQQSGTQYVVVKID